MILTSNRQDEIIVRATRRLVSAMIYMAGPQDENKPQAPAITGFLIRDKKPTGSLTARNAFIQNAEFWQWEDECETRIPKEPTVIVKAVEIVKDRTHRVNNGEFEDFEIQKAVFNSEDIVSRVTGVPPKMHVDFKDATAENEKIIATVPFKRLRTYLGRLEENLSKIGGHLVGADIAHGDSMSAFDYYEISFGLHMGRKLSYGDVMLRRAQNMLSGQMTSLGTLVQKLN